MTDRPFVDGTAQSSTALRYGSYVKPLTHMPIRKFTLECTFMRTTVLASVFALGLVGLVGLVGCKDLTGNQALPAGTTDPVHYNTKQGALLERNAAMLSFFGSFSKYILDAGLITDELSDPNTGASAGFLLAAGHDVRNPLDERILPQSQRYSTDLSNRDGSMSYGLLQGTRGFASQAISMLATYDTAAADLESQKIMRAELYALTGYSEIMLADLFCSGVPLSTLDFERDYTYHASSTRDQVYRAAIAQFDTALIWADTSTQIQNLARVGRGRAYLDLGQYDSAATSVQSVPDGFRYQISSLETGTSEWIGDYGCGGQTCPSSFGVSDQEGGTGLPFLSSGDPRSADTAIGINSNTGLMMSFPLKYFDVRTSNRLTLTVASGVEARLIEAERALNTGDASWLTTLKTLHDTITGVAPLPATVPTSDSAKVALLFQERAEWLYLTGSRQGDLRRLLRQYSQYWPDQDRVYPRGAYRAPGTGTYGSDVTVPIPTAESVNPFFHGCLSRDP